jgi:PDZ domain-containing protein
MLPSWPTALDYLLIMCTGWEIRSRFLGVRRERAGMGSNESRADLGLLAITAFRAVMTFFQKQQQRGGSKAMLSAKRGLGFFVAVSFFIGLVTLVVLPTPYLIERPGPTFDVLGEIDGQPVIQINGEQSYASEGQLDVLTVSIVGRPERTPSWIEIGLAWLDSRQKVVPVEALYPPDRTSEEVQAESSAMMEVSQQDAVAAALEYLGYETPRDIYIAQVTADSPSSGKLVAADVVISVNEERLTSIDQLRSIIGDWDEGAPVAVTVNRAGVLTTKQVTPEKDAEGNFRLGILVGYKYDFPVDVELQLGDVGGPSGGMMFALGIIDRLTPGDLTGGLHVAGTGTIQQSGIVGPIGGVVLKLYGAKAAGATVFLAPAGNCPEIVGNEPEGLRVVKIEKLSDAILALEKLSKNQNLASLPSCTK